MYHQILIFANSVTVYSKKGRQLQKSSIFCNCCHKKRPTITDPVPKRSQLKRMPRFRGIRLSVVLVRLYSAVVSVVSSASVASVSVVSVVSVVYVVSEVSVVSVVVAGAAFSEGTLSALRHVHLESVFTEIWMSPLSRLSRRMLMIAWLSTGASSSE